MEESERQTYFSRCQGTQGQRNQPSAILISERSQRSTFAFYSPQRVSLCGSLLSSIYTPNHGQSATVRFTIPCSKFALPKFGCPKKTDPERESGPNISSAISRIEVPRSTRNYYPYFEGVPLAPFEAAGGHGVPAGG